MATMRTAEAARMLDVDRRTIHRLVTAGELTPADKNDGPLGAYLFDEDAVRTLANRRANEALERAESARAAANGGTA